MKLTLLPVEQVQVCIGSGTVLEHKSQALNFLNLLYSTIVGNEGGIYAWSHNLEVEVDYLEKMIYQSDVPYLYIYKYIDAILLNHRYTRRDDSVEYKEASKKLCLRIWEDLVDVVTDRYSIKFDRKE